MDWKAIAGQIAPLLGTAFGGPLGGMATSVITKAILGKDTATDAEISTAMQNLTPEALAALKKAEMDFKAEMDKHQIDLAALQFQDTDSARKAGTMRQTSKTWWLEPVLALLVVVAFFFTCGGLIYVATRNLTLDPQAHDIIVMLLGVLAAKFSDVYGYFFGSSSGSKLKDESLYPGQSK